MSMILRYSEVPLLSLECSVFVLDPAISNWKPGDSGKSKLYLMQNSGTKATRLVTQDLGTQAVGVTWGFFIIFCDFFFHH